MITNSANSRRVRVILSLSCLLTGTAAYSQNARLTLAQPLASGPSMLVTAAFTPGPAAPVASLQFSLKYSLDEFSGVIVSPGEAAISAGKEIFCSTSAGIVTCLVVGLNTNVIPSGPIANCFLVPSSSSQDTSIQLTSALGATPDASTVLVDLVNPSNAPRGYISGGGGDGGFVASLTGEGNLDWVHWGDTSLMRKANVTPLISDYRIVGSGSPAAYSNDIRWLVWSDGAPVGISGPNSNGVYSVGVGSGFSLTAPADTATRTLVIHAGGWASSGKFTAHLSDASAADYNDVTSFKPVLYDRDYILVYRAASANQTLTVTWTVAAEPGAVTLSAAALSN